MSIGRARAQWTWIGCALCALIGSTPSGVAFGGGDDDHVTLTDPAGDATARRTDPGADGEILAGAVLPDLLSVVMGGWEATSPAANPYAGAFIRGRDAELLRLDLVFSGLVNPPGPANGATYAPFLFGPSPVFGYLGIDIDDDRATGGEIGAAATQRFLANVARFGATPYGSLGNFAATSGFGGDFDNDFYTAPFFERSGEDFSLSLCGCFSATIVSRTGGDQDGLFEDGETWVLRSRYFPRAGGYREASAMFGGSAVGLYDPQVRIRFSHSMATNQTTVTLVWGLTQNGAAMLAGTPQQDVDQVIDVGGNHASVEEALEDLVEGAAGNNNGPLTGPVSILAQRWNGRDVSSMLDPTRWRVTGLFGAIAANEPTARFIWTDAAFDLVRGDFDSDSVSGLSDVSEFDGALASMDGSTADEDGAANGRVVIRSFGPNFSLYDLDSDGDIDADDRAIIVPPPSCRPDVNHDHTLDSQDYFDFLNEYFEGSPSADYNEQDGLDSQDYFDFLNDFFVGCGSSSH